MGLRTSKKLKEEIILTVYKNTVVTYAKLEKKINTNWQTIRSHCKELELLGIVKLTEKRYHELNNRPYTEISLTKQGIEIFKKLKKMN